MFMSEWREFPSAPWLAGKKKLDVVEIARVPDMLPSLFLSWSGMDLSAPRYIFLGRGGGVKRQNLHQVSKLKISSGYKTVSNPNTRFDGVLLDLKRAVLPFSRHL